MRLLFAVLCAALACAAPIAKTKIRKPSPRAIAVSAKARQQAQTYATNHIENGKASPLENAGGLIPFFERLYRMEHDPTAPSVHVLHYGDSHTAADGWTGVMRSLFQSRFGDGGSGFSLAGYPFRGYRRLGQHVSMSRGWTTLGRLDKESDGNSGLGGVAIETQRTGETISLEVDPQRAELWFLRQPNGGSLILRDGIGVVETISTDGPHGLGVFAFDSHSTRLEAETIDDRPVRLFGWVTEKARGITYESLGINGAQASLPSYWDQAMWAEQIARRDPALIVVAYGTNEASNPNWTLATYKQSFSDLLGRIRAAAPAASILVVGPPDRMYRVRGKGWQTFPRMNAIVDAQRIAAAEYRCAFWDWRGRMGGASAMNRWVTAGFAQRDHVHFTPAGYQLLGEVIYRDILSEYAQFAKIRERVFDQTANGPAKHHPPNHPNRVEEGHDPRP